MALPNGSAAGDAEAIRVLADLAQKASGEYKIETLAPPAGSIGLPEKIPVLIKTGQQPDIRSTRDYLDTWRLKPERRKGTAETTTLASFIDLVNHHKGETSALFAKTTWPNPALSAVIDYHAKNKVDGADNCQHIVRYPFPITDEFKAWIDGNGQPFKQWEFGEFIEERIADLEAVVPPHGDEYEKLFKTKFALPTEMVELSRGLRIHVEERVSNVHMMQSGEAEIVFQTEHKDSKGDALHVPGLFMLCLPIFIDGNPVRIPARLRYRVKPGEGTITWTYQLYRWEFWLRERVRGDFATAVSQTALPAFEGAPEIGR